MMDIYIDGEFAAESEARISVLDGAVQIGDGIFETIRGHLGRPAFLEQHLERMRSSAQFLQIPFAHTGEELRAILAELCSRNKAPEARSRLILTRGTLGGKPSFITTAEPYTPHPPEKYAEGYVVATSSMTHFSKGILTGHKSLNYLAFSLAHKEAKRGGADEGLLLNEMGNVAECTSANIFCVKDGKLLTPDLESGILPGVVRNVVLRLATDASIPVQEKPLPLEELLQSREVFITSSLRGIMPVARIDNKVFGKERLVIEKLSRLYRKELDRACGY